ncbi:MAG: aminoacyl-tRNA deacylase [Bradyrhizobium sp.]
MSLQVAILKVLASHGSGRTTLASLNHDIAILSASGPEWAARLKRLASRVAAIDIFGCGYVVRDAEGWQITASGRVFLAALEAVTQDNRAPVPELAPSQRPEPAARPPGDLIVVGARFRNRIHRRRDAVLRNAKARSGVAKA